MNTDVVIEASRIVEATKLLETHPVLAQKIMRARDTMVQDVELIEGIPTWQDARVVADDFVSEGARVNILCNDDGSYKVLADFTWSETATSNKPLS